MVAWVTVRRNTFKVTHGQVRQHASSQRVLRQFCETCGSPLTYWNEKSPDTIDVTVATLDAPEAVEPVDHIWMDDALAWDRPSDGRPQFRTTRTES